MNPAAPFSPAEYLIGTLETLAKAAAEHGARRGVAAPLLLLIWGYLRRTIARLSRLAARQGQPPMRPRSPRKPAPRPARPTPAVRLPRGKSWLIRQVQETAFGYYRLQHLFAQPETAAWLAETPQAGRLLRPLCRMLGIDPPPLIARPPPRPAAPATPALCPDLAGAGQAEASGPAALPPPPRRRAPRRDIRPAICGPPDPA